MIALEVFSQLTGENLAAQPVAGTGVLEADGTVYPVDGSAKDRDEPCGGRGSVLLPRGTWRRRRAWRGRSGGSP